MLVFGALIVQGASIVMAYNRTAATTYARGWYDTDVLNDHKANHINNSNEAAKTYSPQVTRNYLWYYNDGSDYGSDSISEQVLDAKKNLVPNGKDCANFVSQCLIAGQITMYGPGAGGTITSAAQLKDDLFNISKPVPFTLANVPSNLEPGDVIIFNEGATYHAAIVVGENSAGPTLDAHSSDRDQEPLSFYLDNNPREAFAYHIPDGVGSIPPISPYSPDITMTMTDQNGGTIGNGSYTSALNLNVQASAPDGVNNLSVQLSSPDFNNETGIVNPSGLLAEIAPLDSVETLNAMSKYQMP